MTKREYKLLEIDVSYKNDFVRRVNNYLKSGWELHGDTVVVRFHEDLVCYSQAFVRIKDEA